VVDTKLHNPVSRAGTLSEEQRVDSKLQSPRASPGEEMKYCRLEKIQVGGESRERATKYRGRVMK
jgi:hypothetical protein